MTYLISVLLALFTFVAAADRPDRPQQSEGYKGPPLELGDKALYFSCVNDDHWREPQSFDISYSEWGKYPLSCGTQVLIPYKSSDATFTLKDNSQTSSPSCSGEYTVIDTNVKKTSLEIVVVDDGVCKISTNNLRKTK